MNAVVIQDDHRRNHDRGSEITQEIGDHRERQQQRVERVSGTAPEFLRNCWLSLARHQVVTVVREAACCFVRGEAVATRPKSLTRLRRSEATDRKKLLGRANGLRCHARVMR
jgi:hypothetical protein